MCDFIVNLKFFTCIQGFIQAVLKEDCYTFGKTITKLYENAGGGLEVLQAWHCIHGGALVEVQGTKPPKLVFMP